MVWPVTPYRNRRATVLCTLVVTVTLDLPHTTAITHGWDCISCDTNTMVVSNFGTWRTDLNLSDPWWVKVTADSHAAIILNNWWNR